MRKNTSTFILMLTVVFAGCGGNNPVASPTDLAGGIDPGTSTEVAGPDAADPGVALDLATSEIGPIDALQEDVPAEVVQNCPGGDLCPCEVPADCLGGYCVPSSKGPVCSSLCSSEETCPEGWVCRPVDSSGGDIQYACQDPLVRLCRPCTQDSECSGPLSGNKAYCVAHGPIGSFCGFECEQDSGCPSGYECKDALLGDGKRAPARQCVPAGGADCPCTDWFKAEALETICYLENEFGRCTGKRTCDVACPVTQTPAAEACNAIDDDCDGVVDNGFPDQDGDGVRDCVDEDVDGDGIANDSDNCPIVANPDQADKDKNGLGDVCDGDLDGDGIKNEQDNCPLYWNEDQADYDHDNVGDACDCDVDGDGVLNQNPGCDVANPVDNCPFLTNADQTDLDADGQGDPCDPDADGDSYPNGSDNCPLAYNPHQADNEADGLGDLCDLDDDNDQVLDEADNCPTVSNADQTDTDADLAGDACDCDIDGDTVGDVNPGCPAPSPKDNCAFTPNPDQADLNQNGVGDACEGDWDHDGIANDSDNCAWTPNPLQDDLDDDGQGDSCDCDIDGDAIANLNPGCPQGESDNCVMVGNPDQADLDGDIQGDACDDDRDGDGDANSSDCAPDDGLVFAGQTEKCNGMDDDCDGVTDGESVLGCTAYYFDGDKDGSGTEVTKCLCAPLDGFTASAPGDCADNDPTVNPAVAEKCNGIDDNCDGRTDPEGSAGCIEYLSDQDGDGIGVATNPACLCVPAYPFTSKVPGDCDDLNAKVHPGQVEVCNGQDDDCDGATDEDQASGCVVRYLDADRDGYGVDGQTRCTCDEEAPYDALEAGDCDDARAEISPGANEFCNLRDDDCDGATDEVGAGGCVPYFADVDRDGVGRSDDFQCRCAPLKPYDTIKDGDCNDADKEVSPLAIEKCNGKDDDCDGLTDEPDSNGCVIYFLDGDLDKYGLISETKCLCAPTAPWSASMVGDCDDTFADVNPGAKEHCNGRDDDCDGLTDEEGAAGCSQLAQDVDRDGFGAGAMRCLCHAVVPWDSIRADDCNDNDKTVNPEAYEKCNGKDDNCDGVVDSPDSSGCKTYYRDSDSDTFGRTAESKCLCSPSEDYTATKGGDCLDTDNTVFPGQIEKCNGKDDDCDGATDPEDAAACSKYFLDADADLYGLTEQVRCLCAPFGDFRAKQGGDCNDLDPGINPKAVELCNDKDDDCDGTVDEEGAVGCVKLYWDEDQDWYGLNAATKCLCHPFERYTAVKGGDCADGDPSVNPGAYEVCENGRDDNCNVQVDEEGCLGCISYFRDTDQDGWGLSSDSKCLGGPTTDYEVTRGGDCNDSNALQNPGMTEICNGFDDDCDGATDEESANGCIVYNADSDGDGFGSPGAFKCLCNPEGVYTTQDASDCNDADPLIYPFAPERCNGKDDSCNGVTDEEGATGCRIWYMDKDSDGFGNPSVSKCLCAAAAPYNSLTPTDCNDNDATIHPSATEACDGFDNDCDSLVDEENANGCAVYYEDSDLDLWGSTLKKCLCKAAGTYTAKQTGDCDDKNAFVYPGAMEKCDGVDNDCDAAIDEANASGCMTYYYDGDTDKYGISTSTSCLCKPTGKFTTLVAGDCNDANAAVNPGALEQCSTSFDDDCDGIVNEEKAVGCASHYWDFDKDKFGVTANMKCLCAATDRYTALVGGDCADTDAAVYPGATESCNGKDDDCDAAIDEENATGCTAFLKDGDRDTYGLSTDKKCLCKATQPYDTVKTGDCNDADAMVNPGATERCNAKDDDCDGIIDEDGAIGCTVYYLDIDQDKYGVTSNSRCLCNGAMGAYTATLQNDCNDSNPAIHPGATEVCNSVDDDCDAQTDEGCPCAHSKCTTGIPLNPWCADPCVGAICKVDTYCCNTAWDNDCVIEARTVCGSLVCPEAQGSCSHSLCVTGSRLLSGCDFTKANCVTTICSRAGYSQCCTATGTAWSASCVAAVASICGKNCN